MGQMVNEVALSALESQAGGARVAKSCRARKGEGRAAGQEETIDVTLPGPELAAPGSLHPMNIALSKMVDVFVGMGYEVVEGPEVEFDHYNFEL